LPENVELKARFPDHNRAEEVLDDIGASYEGLERQVDTYFRVTRGRLKIREIEGKPAELIFYERIESGERRDCLYFLHRFDEPENLRLLLEAGLGSWARVEKTRKVYRYQNVKVNLDDVSGLGRFIEFEAAAEGDPESTNRMVEKLVEKFEIAPGQIVLESYSDLLGDRP